MGLSDANGDILGGGESKLKVCISFFFSLSTSEDKYVISIQFLWTEYGGLSSAECCVSPVQDETGSQDLLICERHRNLLLNSCVWKEGAGGLRRVAMRTKHAEYVLSAPVIMRRVFSYFTSKDFSISSVNKLVNPLGTDQRKSPMRMDCLYLLHEEFHFTWWQQKKVWTISISWYFSENLLFHHKTETLFWRNWPENQKCGCWCPAEFVNKTRTFCLALTITRGVKRTHRWHVHICSVFFWCFSVWAGENMGKPYVTAVYKNSEVQTSSSNLSRHYRNQVQIRLPTKMEQGNIVIPWSHISCVKLFLHRRRLNFWYFSGPWF